MSVPPSKPLLLPRLVPHLFSASPRRKRITNMSTSDADSATGSPTKKWHTISSSEAESDTEKILRIRLDLEVKIAQLEGELKVKKLEAAHMQKTINDLEADKEALTRDRDLYKLFTHKHIDKISAQKPAGELSGEAAAQGLELDSPWR
ncbi:hypothetical protein B0H11DRAFT_2242270 [Mycena galericulata]|nr:hypothetical protein B0H11DRAFT_2242270 [Mycena galericulata]